ncbi:MAG TPA: site-specific integrase, partial [Gemmataceae bacterium]|nr:site-specific integrase [Gemmataceae bacterium]
LSDTLYIKFPCARTCGKATCPGYHVESTGLRHDAPGAQAKAEKLLRKRLGEVDGGKLIGPAPLKTTFFEMAEAARGDYRSKRLRTLKRLNYSIKHLEDFFGPATLAVAITKDRLDAYVAARRKDKAADATIHAELAALSKMFTCAIEAGKLTAAQRPVFPSLGKLHNARTGVFEEAEFRKVLAELSDDLKPFVEAAFWSGWRKRELLNLRWSQIDFMRGEMKLGREHSKNGQPRVFPFSELPPLRDVLYRQRQRTDEIEKEIGRKVEYVFHRRGNIIKEYYAAWRSACKRAGVSGRLVHDFRRTAVDRLEWSGVPRAVAMKLTGHETDAVYSRYHIARGKDLRAGVARVADYIEALNVSAQESGKEAATAIRVPKAGSRK